MSQNLISKLPEDGVQYSSNDVPDGTYTPDQITARINSQAAQFAKVYNTGRTSGSDWSDLTKGQAPTDGPA